MPDAVPLDITSFAYDTTRCKSPVLGLPLPPEFFGFIGQIIVLSSRLEIQFIEIIAATNKASGQPTRKIARVFSDIVPQFVKFTDEMFADMPTTRAYLGAIANDAIKFQADRNLIAHGRIVTTNAGVVGMTVTSTKPNENRQKVYSIVDLENVFYEISHICGRLNAFSLSFAVPNRLKGQVSDDELPKIHQFLRDNYSMLPSGGA